MKKRLQKLMMLIMAATVLVSSPAQALYAYNIDTQILLDDDEDSDEEDADEADEEDEVVVGDTELRATKSVITLEVGDTDDAEYYSGESVEDDTTTFKSSNTQVAKVDETTGEVVALALGTATITAKADGATTTATWTVNVTSTNVTIKAKKEVSLKSICSNVKKYKNAKYKVSKKKIAKVSNKKIKGLKAGTCKVTFTANKVKYTINVTVKK